jgi:hypothetical protein
MAFENLPQIASAPQDGNLVTVTASDDPVVLVLGTSPSGDTETFYTVDSVSQAAKTFGRGDGTLVRGMYEVRAGGAQEMRLMRVGATSAKLELVGGGITIETKEKDLTAGLQFKLFWDDTAKRLRIYRVSDSVLIYDNNPAYPAAAVDKNEISVTGTNKHSPGDIGTLALPATMAAAHLTSGAVYTAGNDGIELSRMELFEAFFKAYKLLENQDVDIVVPMNAYLDDQSVTDKTTAQVDDVVNSGAPWASSSTGYPNPGDESYDVLGEVFAQEYEGKWYFWWDMDRDGQAEIFPSVGSATGQADAFGTALGQADFHEANFAYQLADFCYRQSQDNAEMIGVIGTLPPKSWSLKDVSAWVGRLPTYTEDSAGNSVVKTATSNGTGLMGIKWMAGRLADGNGKPSHIVNAIGGLQDGGFIATDNGWPDGDQQKDRNEHLIDIGKYISVVGAQAILSNPTNANSYVASGAAAYAGFVSTLPPSSAPTNKVMPGVRLPFRISVAKLDTLAGLRYVMFQNKPKGIVVADAPTAARPDSDYRRLTTWRIVKASMDAIRTVGEPFLGEGITAARLAALETAIDQALTKLQKAEYLQRFDAKVTSTPTQQVQGKVDVELILVPAFEMRQITVTISLAAQ